MMSLPAQGVSVRGGGGGLSKWGLCPGGSLSREFPTEYSKELAVRILLECILV